ncbi:MAG: hypothetical protein H7831_06885 [Magnetococcus sp. WYHC-3]
MSLKEKIKAFDDIRKKKVTVAAWGVEIEFRSMTGMERMTAIQNSLGPDGKIDQVKFNLYTIISCCFDPATGEKVFSASDVDWLAGKSAQAIEVLVTNSLEVSGLLGDQSVKAAEKN